MERDLTDALWLDERAVTLIELSECSGFAEAELRELVDLGALEPVDPEASEWSFGARCIVTARTARRLQIDFELDTHGLAVVMSLLDRVRELEDELQRLDARLPRLRRP